MNAEQLNSFLQRLHPKPLECRIEVIGLSYLPFVRARTLSISPKISFAMFTSLLPPFARRLRFLGLFVCLFATLVGSLSAATKTIDVSVSKDRATGRVTLPQGTYTITLQTRDMRGQWRAIETRAAVPGDLVLSLPASNRRAMFRIQATIETPSRKKFPTVFYRGRNSFAPSQVTPQNDFNRSLAYASAMSPALDAPAPAGESPVEADIWKISGSTAYFFNQLRGLQVVDVSDPASPVLKASYRLPASGQDLYLLPSASGYQDVLLVTNDQPLNGSAYSTGLHVIRVEGASTRLLSSTRVAGQPQGSRLAGRRLFLCTTDWSTGYYDSSTALTEWLVADDTAPALQQTIPLSGWFSTLAAGSDWLAVALTPSGQWGISTAFVYHLSSTGLSALTAGPVTLAGQLGDAYKLQWSGGVLTTISQAWPSDGSPRTTWLETFRADGPAATGERLGQLELARGETLHATRFAGDKAYIVTFLQKDPLFVVDLSDPAQPAIAGQVDVPGWSTHIEPIGDKLFTVGWDAGAVTASLFDVSDPAAPTLLRRLALTEGYGYSEANWDPQALSVLPDAGLALIPITSYAEGAATHGVRLVDIDLAGGDLHARGLIPGRFEARRAALVGDTAVTLSQRTLATATIADRDSPAILADSLLAWPVDRVLPSGDRVLGVETGGAWGGGQPTVRVSPLASPDSILAELDLPSGFIHDVALRDGRLYVLRESASSNNLPLYRYWFAPLGKLSLDVYDATDPLAPQLLGTCEAPNDGLSGSRVSRLLWPRAERPVIIVENESSYYWMRPMPIDIAVPRFVAAPLPGAPLVSAAAVKDAPAVAATPVASLAVNTSRIASWIPWPGNAQPRLIAFDVSNPAAPSAAPALTVGPENASTTAVKTAGDGLVVLGYDRWAERTILRKDGLPASFQSELLHAAQVIVVPATGNAAARPAIDLPGSVFAVTELSAEGFLAFTRTVAPDGKALFQASACDGWDAFEVAQLKVAVTGPVAAAGRALYYTAGDTVNRLALKNTGHFVAAGTIKSSWAPSELRVLDGRVLGSTWRRLFSAPADAKTAPSEWSFTTGFDLQTIERADDGSLVIPMGDYGYELARP